MLSTKYTFDVYETGKSVFLKISKDSKELVFEVVGKTTVDAMWKHAASLTDGQIDQWFKKV